MKAEKENDKLNILFPCLPDVERAIGGVKQLYRHAEILDKSGFNALVITENKDFRPRWFKSKARTKEVNAIKEDRSVTPDNTVVVMPETYVGADQNNLIGWDIRNYKKVIFNQNAYYTTQGQSLETIDNFYGNKKVIHVLAISEDTYNYLNTIMGIPDERISRIINSIESYFVPEERKERLSTGCQERSWGIHGIINTRLLNILNGNRWRGEGLNNMSHEEVAQRLNSSSIFLSFGSPEGFGLPVAEAMASGNWVIGYTGMGAKELFKYGASTEIEFGDWTKFGKSIASVIEKFELNERETNLRVRRQSKAVRHLYSREEEEKSVMEAWIRIEGMFKSNT